MISNFMKMFGSYLMYTAVSIAVLMYYELIAVNYFTPFCIWAWGMLILVFFILRDKREENHDDKEFEELVQSINTKSESIMRKMENLKKDKDK